MEFNRGNSVSNLTRPFECPVCTSQNTAVNKYEDRDSDTPGHNHLHFGEMQCDECGTEWKATWECVNIEVRPPEKQGDAEMADLAAEWENLECPVCDGPMYPLGILGHTVWFRCQNCAVDVPQTLVDQFNV